MFSCSSLCLRALGCVSSAIVIWLNSLSISGPYFSWNCAENSVMSPSISSGAMIMS